DQTRGWFYTMHAIATVVMDNLAYKNVVVNGLVLDEKGEKMSKSKGNAVDPFALIEKHGIDVIRWYMMSNSPPWENLKFSERGIVETQRKFFNTIANVYSFFATYANVDGFVYESPIALSERPEMDRWILSRLATTSIEAEQALNEYNPTKAARCIEAFVDELSNWYIRRNRRRFWSAKDGGSSRKEKDAAYQTVAECLLTLSRLMAPIAPFYAEWLFKSLNDEMGLLTSESVHLAQFPSSKEVFGFVDVALEHKMFLARTVSSIALALRNTAAINVRQPLPRIMVVTGQCVEKDVVEGVSGIVLDEINVKQIEYVSGSSDVVKRTAKPNFKTLGKRLGKHMKAVSSLIRELDVDAIDRFLASGELKVTLEGEDVVLQSEDIEISSEGIEGWLVGQENGITVALDTALSPELVAEGLSRETVNRVQNMRKDADYAVTDRISVTFNGSDSIVSAINLHKEWIRNETLSIEFEKTDVPSGEFLAEFEINDEHLTIGIRR
ncbi:class I tRNA ligase family protein, partial [bacterium]|nr:class I tRNA ligase family protein [bacterium]